MNDLRVKKVENKHELEQVFNIRKNVFIEEQNVPTEIEMDEFDNIAEHFIAYLNDKPIGCARIRFNDHLKLERIAIIKEYREKGFGTQLTKYLIKYSLKRNESDIIMHSQYYAKDFYKKFGFVEVGEPFYEAGIKHIKMILKN